MTLVLSSQASIWTPGQNNPGVDLCLEGARDTKNTLTPQTTYSITRTWTRRTAQQFKKFKNKTKKVVDIANKLRYIN
jgi:hypothetical protein